MNMPENKFILVFSFSFFIFMSLITPSLSETLQGSVEETDALTRLSRPTNLNGNANQTNSLRIERGNSGSGLSGMVDTSQFSNPLTGNLKSDSASLGLVRPDAFHDLSANKFDLGADRGSKELVVAWERWYRQLSAAIYARWSQVVDIPGHAVIRITVTRDRVLNATMVRSSGNRHFDETLLQAILSLSDNPGLTFPSQSQRTTVSVESDYIAGTDIEPGYSWVRNDFEKVNESY